MSEFVYDPANKGGDLPPCAGPEYSEEAATADYTLTMEETVRLNIAVGLIARLPSFSDKDVSSLTKAAERIEGYVIQYEEDGDQ